MVLIKDRFQKKVEAEAGPGVKMSRLVTLFRSVLQQLARHLRYLTTACNHLGLR